MRRFQPAPVRATIPHFVRAGRPRPSSGTRLTLRVSQRARFHPRPPTSAQPVLTEVVHCSAKRESGPPLVPDFELRLASQLATFTGEGSPLPVRSGHIPTDVGDTGPAVGDRLAGGDGRVLDVAGPVLRRRERAPRVAGRGTQRGRPRARGGTGQRVEITHPSNRIASKQSADAVARPTCAARNRVTRRSSRQKRGRAC
jgi:hypothetical protein